MKMTDLRDLIEREIEQYLEWPTVDKSHVTTVSAKLFAEHVARLYADHIPDSGKMVEPAAHREPVAYAVFASNGNIRIWCADPAQVETLRQQYGEALKPLYTAPQPVEQQPAPAVADLVKALDLALEYWRDRQQRYKNRRPKWVAAAESAIETHRSQGGGDEDDQ